MLSTKNLEHLYKGETPIYYTDFSTGKGEHVLILGKSGSGKTTLLHIMAGLLKPTKGNVTINNTDLYTLSGSDVDQFRGKNIGIIFQTPHLIKNFTVKENILSGAYFAGNMSNKDGILRTAASLAIEDKLPKYPDQISRGEAQRVAIARAVINNPAIILADEPTASLDDDNCKHVIELLLEQAEKHGATLIITTHDQRLKPYFKTIYSLDKVRN